MRLLTYLLLTIYATTAVSTDISAEEECGSLGVMKIDPADLPEGVTPADVRKCADHRLGMSIVMGLAMSRKATLQSLQRMKPLTPVSICTFRAAPWCRRWWYVATYSAGLDALRGILSPELVLA
ncbi:hypothetical protein AAWM_09869 [Aspergillus awamori]|uniref:Uncharacterized protein n=1 Tax=Aspergillus awamori TaxID=105351 RepID=A0A401L625_ASPAW|nr:hypothetical protein AAWM_09869 [Aspergillus awamori]GKZ59186.1 hypothetical protein AnigIFM49718_005047 [Aspergillus niger]